jgi:hypothetical protein
MRLNTLVARCLVLVAGSILPIVHAFAATLVDAVPHRVTLDGIIHPKTDDTLAFTPDGNTVFFDRGENKHETIMVSHNVNGRWSPPRVASFSGRWHDKDPAMSPDGSWLVFASNRPTSPGGAPVVSHYQGHAYHGDNLWKVERAGQGWGTPVWLGPVVNDKAFIAAPSIAADGSLYFIRRENGVTYIFQSRFRNGAYQPSERVVLGAPGVTTHDPAIAPDQSFIVFDYGKTKGGLGRLCIAFREGDHWGKPIDLGDTVNGDGPWGSHLASDDHTIYFTGNSGIWRLSLDPWLRARGIHH